MTWNEARRQEGQRLKRSIWLLLSFASISERAAFLPAPLRFLLLVLMRRAEEVARFIVNDMADGFGLTLVVEAPPATTDSIEEAFRLADTFRVLGLLLADLAYYSGYVEAEPCGHERRNRAFPIHGSRIARLCRSIMRRHVTTLGHAIRAGPVAGAFGTGKMQLAPAASILACPQFSHGALSP